MKLNELRQKSKAELQDMHKECMRRIDELRFALAQGKQKNVKEIMHNKKTIARILTLLNNQ